MERLWTWITVWTLICSLTGFAPHCECYYFPLPLSKNSGHNERVWQKVKCLVISSFNWKKGEEREKSHCRSRRQTGWRRGQGWNLLGGPLQVSVPPTKVWWGSFSKINDSSTLNTPVQCHPPVIQNPWQFSARSYFGWSVRVAWIPKIQK